MRSGTLDPGPAGPPPLSAARTADEASTRGAWIVLWAVLFASVVAALNQFIVPPLLPVLMPAFGVDLSTAGLLVSVFSVVGVVLALPSGLILHRLGPWTAGVAALGLVIAGGVMGALSGSFGLLLASRAVVGAGVGLISVVAPAVIATVFPPERRGTPMGIYATWAPIGVVLAFNGAPRVTSAGSWQPAWWLGVALALVAVLVLGAFVRLPRAAGGVATDESPGLDAFVRRPDIWLVGIAWACYGIGLGTVTSFYPTFLVDERGYDLGVASSLTSLTMLTFLVSCPIAGIVSDRIGSRKLVYTVPTLCMAALWLVPFVLEGWQIPVYMVIAGILSGAFPAATFAAVPEVMVEPRLAGAGMAVLILGQNVGYVAGPAIFGPIVEAAGWNVAGYALIPFTMLGVLAGWKVRVR